jgi:hypothetical protein
MIPSHSILSMLDQIKLVSTSLLLSFILLHRDLTLYFYVEFCQLVSTLGIATKNRLLKMNLFKHQVSLDPPANIERIGLGSTRIYLILLTLSMLILAVFNGLEQEKLVVTISSPSLAKFEQLQAAYSTILTCPCNQITVPYGSFLSVTPEYHQVSCASVCEEKSWIIRNNQRIYATALN